MLYSPHNNSHLHYQFRSSFTTFLIALLAVELLTVGFIRLGLSFRLGLILALSLASIVAMPNQVAGIAEKSALVVMFIATGKWQHTLSSFLAVIAIVQILAVALLQHGVELGVVLAVACGIIAAYFVWPKVFALIVRMKTWAASKATSISRPQFSIKSLLVVVAIVSVVSAKVGSDLRQAKRELFVTNKLKDLGADVAFDLMRTRNEASRLGVVKWLADVKKEATKGQDSLTRDGDAKAQSLVKWLVGLDGAEVNYVVLNIPYALLGKRNDNITDDCLADVASLKSLRVLDMRGTNITDAGLVHLQALQELELILIGGTHITDDGIRRFQEFNERCDIYR